VSLGTNSMVSATNASSCFALGCYSLYNLVTGSNHVAIGFQSLFEVNGVNGCIAIGSQSGKYETNGNRLYITNQAGSNLADGIARAIIYGVMSTTTASQELYFHAKTEIGFNSALTNTIQNLSRLKHTTSGAAAALFGASHEVELEDDAGNSQVASETATLWASAASGSESPLLRDTTYPSGSAGPGYRGFWTWTALDGTSRTVIPNGTGDVTAVLTAQYALTESGGGTDGGLITVDNGATVDLYDDGVDICTLTVNADGSVTIARSAGAATFDVVLNMVWL
jgi:hypothetical protein